MTPFRTQQHQKNPAPPAVADATESSAPRVWDDMTVEVALSVMAGAGVDLLLVCDGDDQCTGSITRAQLTVLRDSPAYTDRLRLRDVVAGRPGPPGATLAGTGRPGRARRSPLNRLAPVSPFSFSL